MLIDLNPTIGMPIQDLDIIMNHHLSVIKHSKWEQALNSIINRVMIQDLANTTQVRNLCCQAMEQMDLESLRETMISIMNYQEHLIQDQVLMITNFLMDVVL